MAELLIELLTEEIPPVQQIDARQKIKQMFDEKLKQKEINFKSSLSFSSPKRLVFLIKGIPEQIKKKERIIKGPKVDAPQAAIDGFIRSNNLHKSDIHKKKIDKGEFYFAKIEPQVTNILKELEKIVPEILGNYSWKKSMKWASYDLNWGRPLISILALFNNKTINFDFFHINSSNLTLVPGATEEKIVKVNNFTAYSKLLENQGIILDHEKRKDIIVKKMSNICNLKKLKNNFSSTLIEEVVNIVEKPNIIQGEFNEAYLNIPEEILIVTMEQQQKYFPLFDINNKLTNYFLFVANLPDKKGYIKKGNERVIEARLSDAKFFWEKNKNQNLVKQVSKLKSLSFFNKLGTFYDRTQRVRKLSSLISDQLNLNKEKVEIASSICKADLVSDLVGEYPELQGVMGKYFALEQGFDKDISIAISDHYLPLNINSDVAKKNISIAVSIIDKVDVLVGFFGINEKPTSSKDPFALRRTAIGLLRTIIENKLKINLRDLINYSIVVYKEQKVEFVNNSTLNELLNFLRERFKNLLKNKNIRSDIVEAVNESNTNNDFLVFYNKCLIVNKNITKDIFKNIVGTYKRAFNIIEQELKNKKEEFLQNPQTSLFKTNEEKDLYKKINEIRQYFSNTNKNENYEETLKILSGAKLTTDSFFDNVIVKDENLDIKKNRLELLQMFCKTYNNFIDFSKVERI